MDSQLMANCKEYRTTVTVSTSLGHGSVSEIGIDIDTGTLLGMLVRAAVAAGWPMRAMEESVCDFADAIKRSESWD